MLLLELLGEEVHDPHVEVLAPEESVAIRRFHLEEAVVDLEDGDVEGAAAEVVDRDRLRFLLVETIGERRRGGLVDDAQDLEPRDLARVLGGLTLGVVEIGGHRDDGLRHRLAKIGLGGLLHLLEDDGGNLGGAVFLPAGLDPGVAVAAVDHRIGQVLAVLGDHRVVRAPADQALDRKDRVGRVRDRLPLGRLAHEALAVGEGDDRGRRARPFGVLDHARLGAIHDGNAAVRGSKVDTDDFGHNLRSSRLRRPRGARFRHPPRSLGRFWTSHARDGARRGDSRYIGRRFCRRKAPPPYCPRPRAFQLSETRLRV